MATLKAKLKMDRDEWKEASAMPWLKGPFRIYRFRDLGMLDKPAEAFVESVDQSIRTDGFFSMVYRHCYLIVCGEWRSAIVNMYGWTLLGEFSTLSDAMALGYADTLAEGVEEISEATV